MEVKPLFDRLKRSASPSPLDPRPNKLLRHEPGLITGRMDSEPPKTFHRIQNSPEEIVVRLPGFPSKRCASSSPANPRPAKRSRYTGAVFAVKVGSNASETFHVHERLLKDNCEFFTKVTWIRQPGYKTNEFLLPDDEPDVFRAYMDWLYEDIVHLRNKHIGEMTQADHVAEWAILSKLYVLAVKLQDHRFCDATMEAMIAKMEEKDQDDKKWWPSNQTIVTLYNGTSRGSPVRDLLLEAYTHGPKGASELISEDDEANHVTFLADLARILLKRSQVDIWDTHFSSQKERFLHRGRPDYLARGGRSWQ